MKRGIIIFLVLTLLIKLDIFSQPTFTNQSNFGIGASLSADWGDYDNDGDLDLVIGNLNGDYIYINEGSNEFTESEIFDTYHSNFVKWIDLDNDTDLDLIIGNKGDTPNYLFYNQGNGELIQNEFLSGYDLTGIDNGDFDNDGDLDLILSCWDESYTFIWLNDGNNNFSPDFNNDIFNEAISVSVSDVDNDSDLDIITGVGCCINPSEIYKNDGTGTFSLFSTFGSDNLGLSSIKTIDIDNDGDIDITSNNTGTDEIYIFINDGNGNFSEMLIDTNVAFTCTEFCDIDNNGDIDLIVGAYGFFSDRIIIYENTEMNFSKHIIEEGGFTDFPINAVTDIAVGDSDNDGDIDIAVMRCIWEDEFSFEVEQNTLLANNKINAIENIVNKDFYNIFPNPSYDFINIEFSNFEHVTLCLINSMGRTIFEKTILNNKIETIDMTEFPKGIYILKILTQNYSSSEKIIKN